MRPFISWLLLTLLTGNPATDARPATDGDVPVAGPFIQALQLVQQHGTPAAAQDQRLKSTLAKALADDDCIAFEELDGFMTRERFREMAGEKKIRKELAGQQAAAEAAAAAVRLDAAQVARALEARAPASRGKLTARLRNHAELLATSFDLIDEPHRRAGDKLAQWLAANYHPGTPLGVIVVCTGNSRRSILGSSMGNLAAAYYGLEEIRFYSGGTTPSAFNRRTVAALQEIGFDITATGEEARRGDPETPNPIFRVGWGQALDICEFSKHYAHQGNPQRGFAALMVCTEADEGCPVVQGAALRVSLPYLDPKSYDNSPFEAAKYAERRDDIGRLMLSAVCQVRRTLNQ